MKIRTFAGVILALSAVAIAPVSAAANKGKSGGAPPKTTHAAGSTARAPRTTVTHGKPQTTRPTKSSPTATTTKTHGPSRATDTKRSSPTDAKRSSPTAVAATDTPTPTNTTTTLNPIAEKLQNKPLGSRIEGMLPKGMTLDAASSGFKNQGQFIAAVHVSQNLGIPFADLKATMLGTPVAGSTTSDTTATPMSLGQAIQRLKPFANATTEATRAETQATRDLQSTTPTTSTTTTSTSTSTKKSRTRGR